MQSGLNKISDILDEISLDKKKCTNSIQKAVALGFWKDICGPKFAKLSRASNIKGRTLFVAVKNPQVMQELIFSRDMILEKLKNYFSPLNIQIENIRYDYKNWETSTDTHLEGEDSPAVLNREDIEKIELSDEDMKSLNNATNSILSLSFLDNKIKNRLQNNIINSYRAKKLRERGN